MKKSKRKKSKKRITNNYLGMAVISVVVLLLLGGLAMKSHSLRNRIAYYDAQAAELKQQISDEKERTKEIDKRTEYMQTDEYAAEVARDRLGLVKDNEIVFEEEKYHGFWRKVFNCFRLCLTDILEPVLYNGT